MQSPVEPLQTVMAKGARRALIMLENKCDVLEVSAEMLEKVDPVFYSDPQMTAMREPGRKYNGQSADESEKSHFLLTKSSGGQYVVVCFQRCSHQPAMQPTWQSGVHKCL